MGSSTMMRRLRVALFALLAAACAAAVGGACAAPASAGVTSSIASILQKHHLTGARTGVYVWDFDAARLVYAANQDTPLAPASNMKLVTTAAALDHWAPDHRFKTELYGPGVPVYGGVIFGDLYLKGYGDPSLSTLWYQHNVLHMTTASFESFAKRLRKLKVHKVKGSVLGDESYFDKQRTGPWQSSLFSEAGKLSALTGNESLDNGNRVKDPATYAAKLLTEALEQQGITVTGKPGTGTVPGSARLLKQQYSAPLRAILKHMDKESDNFFAEMLVKGLGAEFEGAGSTEAGLNASRATLTSIGLSPDSYSLHDGSGLSYDDRITARDLVRILGAARQRADYRTYYEALAIAGVDGTLEDRMRGTAADDNAHAKTGTLNIAVCLSGYVQTADDRRAAYAIVVNGDAVNWANAAATQDAIVVTLAKAYLPGERTHLAPSARQIPVSALQAVNPTGSYLQAVVQP